MASAGGERLSSLDFKKKKEIEEARKNGTLPPEQDADGNLINPHNPEYISKRPWYLGESGPSLKHQSIQNQSHLLSIQEADELYLRGKKVSSTSATTLRTRPLKWRKGACKNCGAMSHKTEECVERPRKIGAWKTNKDLHQDEVLVDIRSQKYGKLAFDAKRDQWLGYDPRDHTKTVERYERIEEERKRQRMEKVNKKLQRSATKKKVKETDSNETEKPDADSDSDSDYESDAGSESDEEFRDREERMFSERVARQGGLGGAEMKTTVRNLRIREDTAKYLRNLNPNSAYYDPKTRSMRENPNPELHIEDTTFAGDNVVRFTGDAQKLAANQVFAWEAYEKGTQIDPIATPSQAEFMKKQFEERKQALENEKKRKILEKYGGETHLKMPPKELVLAQSESYVEYSRDGRVLKGKERAKVRSKYLEDVLENNHTEVWGSYYDRGEKTWGYACCHSTVRNSYCTGEAGKFAQAAAATASSQSGSSNERKMLLPPRHERGSGQGDHGDSNDKKGESLLSKRSELYGENVAVELDAKKLKQALKRAEREKETRAKEEQEQEQVARDKKKRKYNSGQSHDVTQEDLEAYKLLKSRDDDPMAKLLGSSEVLLEE